MHTCFPPQGEVAQASMKGRTVGPPDLATMDHETKMDLSTWFKSRLGSVAEGTRNTWYGGPGLENFDPSAGATCARAC